MKKQTAVDWLMEQITYDNNGKRYNTYMDYVDLSDFFIQAKELEKQNIIESNKIGVNCGLYNYRNAEEYYNKTFKK